MLGAQDSPQQGLSSLKRCRATAREPWSTHTENRSPKTKDVVFLIQEEIVPTNHILLVVQCHLPFMSWVLIKFYELPVQINTKHFFFF